LRSFGSLVRFPFLIEFEARFRIQTLLLLIHSFICWNRRNPRSVKPLQVLLLRSVHWYWRCIVP
jgi:hypothetical protein